MNIINMRSIISVVADRVFPETSLPKPAFAFRFPAGRSELALWDPLRNAVLIALPSSREIEIAFRQRPKAVEMVRQYDPGIDMKWCPRSHRANRVSQKIDITVSNWLRRSYRLTVKKIGAARNTIYADNQSYRYYGS